MAEGQNKPYLIQDKSEDQEFWDRAFLELLSDPNISWDGAAKMADLALDIRNKRWPKEGE